MTLYTQLLSLSSTASERRPLQIVSPYITINPIRAVLRRVSPLVRIEVTTSFDQDNFLDGSSSIGALSLLVRRRNTLLYSIPSLHAKAYICGDTALVGSANCTDRGLGFSRQSNIELLCVMESCREEIVELVKMLEGSRKRLNVVDINSMITSVAMIKARARSVLRSRLGAILADAEWIPSCSLRYLLKYLTEGTFYRIPIDTRKPILRDAHYLERVFGEKTLENERDVIERISIIPIVQLAMESEKRNSRYLQKCMAARGVPDFQIQALINWAKYCLSVAL